jgi:hypothetical protein
MLANAYLEANPGCDDVEAWHETVKRNPELAAMLPPDLQSIEPTESDEVWETPEPTTETGGNPKLNALLEALRQHHANNPYLSNGAADLVSRAYPPKEPALKRSPLDPNLSKDDVEAALEERRRRFRETGRR